MRVSELGCQAIARPKEGLISGDPIRFLLLLAGYEAALRGRTCFYNPAGSTLAFKPSGVGWQEKKAPQQGESARSPAATQLDISANEMGFLFLHRQQQAFPRILRAAGRNFSGIVGGVNPTAAGQTGPPLTLAD
jgi:hypothetical protein